MATGVELVVGGRTVRVVREDGAILVTDADGRVVRVELDEADGGTPPIRAAKVDGKPIVFGHALRKSSEHNRHTIVLGGMAHELEVLDARRARLAELAPRDGAAAGRIAVKAPIPGLITEVMIAPGDEVEQDQTLVVLYAMKLENEIRATHAGKVKSVQIEPQQSVEKGDLLVEIES